MFQLTIWTLPSALAFGCAALLLPYVWRHRAAPGGWPLAILIAAVAWWALGQAMSTMATTLETKFFAAKLQYLGIVIAPTAWMLFCLRYTHSYPALYRGWAWLTPVPLTTVLLALSNELHGWVWADAELVEVGSFIAWQLNYGPWFPVHRWWSYLLVGGGTLVLLSGLLASPWHRRRVLLIVAAPVLVVATNLFYLLPDSPVRWLDLTPIGFVLAAAVFALALRGDLLDLVPLSRERVVMDMPDSVFVTAAGGRVIDMNPAAERLAARCGSGELGRPLWDLLPIPRESIENHDANGRALDLIMKVNEVDSAWRVSCSDLDDPRGELSGRVFIFHDHTDRWRAETELRATSAALTEANRELTHLVTLDGLTRIPHRAAFLRQCEEEIERARRHGRRLSVLTVRLDNLAQLNTRFGSDLADRVLQALARLFDTVRRKGDPIGRTGAAEFSLLLAETTTDQAQAVGDEILLGVTRSHFRDTSGRPLDLDLRYQLARLEPTVRDADDLLARAQPMQGASGREQPVPS